MGFLDKFKKGLKKTQNRIAEGLATALLGEKEIDDSIEEVLEEVLLEADVGVEATEELIESIVEKVSRRQLKDLQAVLNALKGQVVDMLSVSERSHLLEDNRKPLVVLVVGVNGVGKTTTIGKLAKKYIKMGKTVILGAADTFRAAAIEQLEIWAKKVNCDLVKHKEGSDPSAVAFDTVKAAVSRGIDVAIIDTAGRLHTKENLMKQLEKMKRVISKVITDAPQRVVLVLDATNGQNALNQAKEFQKITGITDIILTKLDGTAKGGIILPIVRQLNVPVAFVGVGEKEDDLIPFDPEEYARGLFEV